MNKHEIIRSLIPRGFARKIFLWFFLIAMIPVIVVGIIGYGKAYNSLYHSTEESLLAISKLKTEYIKSYFSERMKDLTFEAALSSNVRMIQLFKLSHRLSDMPIDKFVRSPEWKSIEVHSLDLKKLQRTYDFDDIFLIDNEGNILFTVMARDDLGTNIFTGKYANTHLSKACKKAFTTGRPVFSDFESYEPAKNNVIGFIAQTMVDEDGEKIGLLVKGIPIQAINYFMQERTGLGETGETYLVGIDLLMRSDSRFSKESTVLKTRVDTEATRQWTWLESGINHNQLEKANDSGRVSIYKDYRMVKVLGTYNTLEIAGVPMVMLTEIDEAEAFGLINVLRKVSVGLLTVTVIAVFFVSNFVARRIVEPLRRLSDWAERVAIGDMTFPKEIITQHNEIGRMNESFKKVSDLLVQVTSVCEAIAIGDFHKTVDLRSDKDRLGKAVNQMAENLRFVVEQADNIAKGDYSVEIVPCSEQDHLRIALFEMAKSLKELDAANEKENWLRRHRVELMDKMRGEQDIATLAFNIISSLASSLNAQIGAIYLADENNILRLVGSYAYTKRKNLSNEFGFGEGLIGQAAMEKQPIVISNVPDTYIKINSGLGEAVPDNIVVVPFLYEKKVKGVFELGTFHEFTDIQLDFLKQVSNNIAIAFNSAQSRVMLEKLLEETQHQAMELEKSEEELRRKNEELQAQTKALKESETQLQTQQEELQQMNEELEERTQELERQKDDVQKKNKELEMAGQEIKKKAEALELASRYKSEFLANMSHELRTPLNSILILSRLLAENKEGNLTKKQIEFGQTIYSSGSDLLALINDILDLSKVEAGKMSINVESVNLDDLLAGIRQKFEPLVKEKGLSFNVAMEDGIPAQIQTDRQKLEQVIKNLISNAIKFTAQGSINLRVYRPDCNIDLSFASLDCKDTIAISISDTGIGIPKECHESIFEAFQQADGTINRRYGGTGLGLSISKKFVRLLGGYLQLQSEEGKGTTFIIYLPERVKEESLTPGVRSVDRGEKTGERRQKAGGMWGRDLNGLNGLKDRSHYPPDRPKETIVPSKETQANGQKGDNGISTLIPRVEPPEHRFIKDDRKSVEPYDKTLLIIEDDVKFAKILVDLAHERGFKCLVAENGETGLHMADYYMPSAIILDVSLPGLNGWIVMERLKDNSNTRHIPVHFISAMDKPIDAMRMGAVGYLTKPVDIEMLDNAFKRIDNLIANTVKNLLVVEDDETMRKSIFELMGNGDIKITSASSGKEAYDLLKSSRFDCMILDIGLPDMSGFDLLEMIKDDSSIYYIPIIIYTGRELSSQEEIRLKKYAETIIIKGARSTERLLDETALFLHRVEKNLPEEKQKMIRMVHDRETILKDNKILLVDDDMRNVFALTNVLEENGMEVMIAKNGRECLECLNKNPDINLVLMDIMMPEMDGYEAMKGIRKQERFKNLPIIALTAKAMKGDKNVCIEAGANDYLAKPVDIDKLVSLLRVWLYK